MANEQRVSVRVELNNGSIVDKFEPPPKVITPTTKVSCGDTATVTVAAEMDLVVPVGSAVTTTNQGILSMVNKDTTNFVKWGVKSGGVMVATGRLYPGVPATIQLEPSAVIRWRADTADCQVQWKMCAK